MNEGQRRALCTSLRRWHAADQVARQFFAGGYQATLRAVWAAATGGLQHDEIALRCGGWTYYVEPSPDGLTLSRARAEEPGPDDLHGPALHALEETLRELQRSVGERRAALFGELDELGLDAPVAVLCDALVGQWAVDTASRAITPARALDLWMVPTAPTIERLYRALPILVEHLARGGGVGLVYEGGGTRLELAGDLVVSPAEERGRIQLVATRSVDTDPGNAGAVVMVLAAAAAALGVDEPSWVLLPLESP